MNKTSTIFLRVIILFIGLGVLAFLLWEPHLEGRNANATFFEIYFKDPFLAYIYLASLPFFAALYKAFKLLKYIGENKVFSLNAVKALSSIKYYAVTIVAFIVGAEGYLFVAQRGKDDIAGAAMLGFIAILISIIVATAAAMFEKLLQTAVDMKSENDLTV